MIGKTQLKFFFFSQVLLLSFGYPKLLFAASRLERDEQGLRERMIERNIEISEWFDGIADGIDLFLVGKRVTQRKNETTVKLGYSAYLKEKDPVSHAPSIGADLKLPNFEQYWNLKFTSYDQTQERGVKKTELKQNVRRENNYGATVGLFQKLGEVRAAFQPRVELQSPLKISHSLSFESIADLQKYQINPKLEFYASHDKGTGAFQALNFHFRLGKKWSFTMVNEGDYEDKNNAYSVTNGFSFGQSISTAQSLSYSLYFGSHSKPHYRLTDYTFAVSWSHVILNRILDYNLTPQWVFDRSVDYSGRAALSASLNIIF